MSRNFKIFIVATVVFWAVGAMNDAVVMYVLAGVCLAVMLVAYLLAQLSLSRLELTMTTPPAGIAAGAPIRPHVHVRSHGGITIGSVAVALSAENLTVEGVRVARRVLLPPVPPAAELDFDFELVPAVRGRYRLSGPVLIDSDPIGMFERRRDRGRCFELVVFPRTWDLPRVAAWDTGHGARGVRRPPTRRDQGEFRGIREHTPGDDLRHVHWKVTAHVGELAVKEYEPLRHDLISIQLDLAARGHYGAGPLSTLETAISAAASIARAGLAEQRSVAVIGDGLPPEVARPGAGQPHMHRIMVALAEARAQGTDSFAHTLTRRLRAVPRGATVFVITTAAEEGLARVLSSNAGHVGSLTLLVVAGDLEGAPERFVVLPRRVSEAAMAAGIAVAPLRSGADIVQALTIATTPARGAGVELL